MTEETPDNHAEPVAVAVHPDRGEAEVTVAHLAANGIEAFIVDQIEGGVIPMEGEWGVAVVVKAVDAELAREVLATDGAIDADVEGDE
jgi:Putative prokaryotic signal transducing protein